MNRLLPVRMRFLLSEAGRKGVTSIIGSKPKRNCALPRRPMVAREYQRLKQTAARKLQPAHNRASESEALICRNGGR